MIRIFVIIVCIIIIWRITISSYTNATELKRYAPCL